MSTYYEIGYPLAKAASVITFIVTWIYCVAAYGFLLGAAFGWIPAIIIACLAHTVVFFGWAPILLFGWLYIKEIYRL